MERFRKEPLLIEESDSITLQTLKQECNQLIEEYNRLAAPFSEQGGELITRISFLLHKIALFKRI